MADRRSLGDAIVLSPEKMAFINGSETNKSTSSSTLAEKKATQTIELSTNRKADTHPREPEATRPRERQKRQRGINVAQSGSDDLLDKMLVPLTTRLPNGLFQSLRRICLEQKIQRAKPDSIQEIVQVALEDWLKRN